MAAHESGELSTDETALYLVWSLTDPERLPGEFTSGAGMEKCGTPGALWAHRALDQLSAPVAGEVERGLARPGFTGPHLHFVSPGGNFRIHYTNQGGDAVSEDYAMEVAVAADLSWEVAVNEMLYHSPPPDQGMGGCNRYDMYIKNIPYMGYATHSGEHKPPDSTQNASASHVVISNSLSSNHIKVTVAHEFKHAIQFTYDYTEPTWYMENCAVFMEEMVYPEINDYMSYLGGGDNPIRKPWWDIRSGAGNLYWYGGVTWPFYIWQRNEVEAVRRTWEYCSYFNGPNVMSALEDTFSEYGMTFEQGFMEYGYWRWFVSSQWIDGGMYFAEAAQWPANPYIFPFHSVNSLPASGDEGVYPPESYGLHWIRVNLANYQDGWVNFSFDGRDYFDWKVGVILWDTDGFAYCTWHDTELPDATVSINVPTTGYDYAIFYPAMLSPTSLSMFYEYDITFSQGMEENGIPVSGPTLSVHSNPLAPGGSVTFSIPEAGTVSLGLFDLTGRRVSTLAHGPMAEGVHSAGLSRELAAGTYFLMLSHPGGVETMKVVVAR